MTCQTCNGLGYVDTWAVDWKHGGTICTGSVRCTDCNDRPVAAPPWECGSCNGVGLINIGTEIIVCPCGGSGDLLPAAIEPELVGVG